MLMMFMQSKILYSATLLGQRLALPGSPPETEISNENELFFSEPEFPCIHTQHILDKPTCCWRNRGTERWPSLLNHNGSLAGLPRCEALQHDVKH